MTLFDPGVVARQNGRADAFLLGERRLSPSIRGQNIVAAGNHNRELILHHIRARGAISRAELADLTGLTQPAIFKITKDLLTENWLVAKAMKDGSRGQPTSVISLNPDGAYSLGLNIDRDHITFVVLDFAGGVRETIRRNIVNPTPKDVQQVFSKCLLAAQARNRHLRSSTVGVGLSIPDDFTKGNPWLQHQWRDASVDGLLRAVTDLPIVRENDAAAAAIGELTFGAGLHVDSFFYLYLSVGLGGGLVINRDYFRGSHGRSGELGYLPQVNPFRSSRSALGALIEEPVSAPGLLKALCEAGAKATGLEQIDWSDARVQAAMIEWSKQAADLLYLPVLSIVCCVDPDAVLIGGQLPPVATQQLALELNKRLSLNVEIDWSERIVRPGKLTADAAAIGAAVAGFRDMWTRNANRLSDGGPTA
jgi:predicted NBD/HSP70 family sugar kinase